MSRRMELIMAAAFGVMLAISSPAAQAQAPKTKEKPEKPEMAAGGLYKCVDADGNTTYTNTGSVKGCKKIETDTINTVSMARPSKPVSGSAKVDAGAQRTRDSDRRRILQDELVAEEKRLADLKKEFNNGEPERQGDERNYQKYLDRAEKLKADVARGEANVDSLKRELDSIKD